MGTSERLPWERSEVKTRRSPAEKRPRRVRRAGLWLPPQVRWEPEPTSRDEGSAQASKWERQALNSLPCLATPLAPRPGSGPGRGKKGQISSRRVRWNPDCV